MNNLIDLTRRELLAGAGAGAAALLLNQRGAEAQPSAGRTVVFANTTVVTVDAVRDEVSLAVTGDTIVAIGPTDQVLKSYPNAEIYNGRGKALFPGLINCHAHLAQTLGRGFNEDFGFPNSAQLAVQPTSLLQGEEGTLMAVIGALEGIRTGTTTLVENTGGIARNAGALAQTGLRWVFAESIRDSENVAGPMSPEGLAKSVPPTFSAKLRDEGMQRINDLFSKWHGANQGRISVFPAAALAETALRDPMRAIVSTFPKVSTQSDQAEDALAPFPWTPSERCAGKFWESSTNRDDTPGGKGWGAVSTMSPRRGTIRGHNGPIPYTPVDSPTHVWSDA